jgi:tRNA/tmRNA/rRNA uracil-C5-methylase (TrmA/RlmC/RlmD family)|tara:strand:- start:1780 stop:2961 length:1182 start_codon:yes stop_codon:yes gene_type:complete
VVKSLNIGDRIEVEIGPIAHGGHFISRHNGQVVFVRHGITGEKAIVEITSVSSKLAHGDAVEILEKSTERIEPACKYAIPGGCGGCDFQHIALSAQQKMKLDVVKDQFLRIGKIEVDPEMIIVEPKDGLHWRTRFDFAVSNNGHVGLYASKTKKIIEIDECLIGLKEINTPEVFNKKWNGDDRVRVAVSSSGQKNISRGKFTISGPSKLREVIGENTYNISSHSFWQSHIRAPKTLTDLSLDFMNLKPGDIVCDLYGGVGLFTMPIAEKIGNHGHVHLIELSNQATRDASKIFKGYNNVSIHKGSVDKKLRYIQDIDVILLDPPRTGAGKIAIDQISSKKPRTIVYISCDPASLARDSRFLEDSGYSLDKITAVDLFPMTHHIECVVKFVLKN